MMRAVATVVFAIGLGALPALAADGPGDVGLPTDVLKLDYACMARLWSEWQDINDGFDSEYNQDVLEDAIGPWSDDAATRTGRTPEEVAAGPEVKAEVDNLVDSVARDVFEQQLAYCTANEPVAE
ncbi:MAG TPA: hypothetical protein VG894_13410 [Bauldia sp.]|nr:hypothetical protein [Bauldia sp.]